MVGVDYVPGLLADGRARAKAEGLKITFLEGDAEKLPVEAGDFDAVLSIYGVMFAPDHQRAANELLRAVRSGGTIALASWIPSGFIGDMFRTIAKLDDENQKALFDDLVQLARTVDIHQDGGSIAVPATYLETIARRR